jgi:ribonuclease G
MQKEMIISANGHETMVAILEEDLVSEFFIERERHRGVVGNIYKGRVSKVLPGMQCAFIDIGLERDGFLYVSDVVDTIEEFDRLDSGDDEEHENGGNGKGAERGKSRERVQPKIEELLKEGQEIVVQVAKEPLGTKGARLTSHATLAGRFLVFMPTVDHVGVSRKIESRDERNRLRGIVRKFPRRARLRRRRDYPHCRWQPSRAGHPQRPALLQRHLEGHAAQVRDLTGARGDLPRAEPCLEAPARSSERRLLRHPDR